MTKLRLFFSSRIVQNYIPNKIPPSASASFTELAEQTQPLGPENVVFAAAALLAGAAVASAVSVGEWIFRDGGSSKTKGEI